MMIGVVGLGAVGMFLVYSLNRAGIEPLVVTRTWHDDYVFVVGGERVRLRFRRVSSLPSDVKRTLLCVKAYDTSNALKSAVGTVTVFQNGIGGLELARNMLGRAYGAVVTYGVTRIGGTAELRGTGEIILDDAYIAELLERGGVRTRVVEDIDSYRWLKTIVNAAINPITAVLGSKNAVILSNPWARSLAAQVVSEGKAVAKRLGIGLPEDPWTSLVRVVEATGENMSSTLQDVLAGRPTEVDYMNGAIVRYGSAHGVAVPVNRVLWFAVRGLVQAGFASRRVAFLCGACM